MKVDYMEASQRRFERAAGTGTATLASDIGYYYIEDIGMLDANDEYIPDQNDDDGSIEEVKEVLLKACDCFYFLREGWYIKKGTKINITRFDTRGSMYFTVGKFEFWICDLNFDPEEFVESCFVVSHSPFRWTRVFNDRSPIYINMEINNEIRINGYYICEFGMFPGVYTPLEYAQFNDVRLEEIQYPDAIAYVVLEDVYCLTKDCKVVEIETPYTKRRK